MTANHFLHPTISSVVWKEDLTLEEKYLQLEEYRGRMREALMEAYKGTSFTSGKWKEEGLRAKEGDVIMVSRGKNKVRPLGRIEFALVREVSEDGRTLQVRVCRSHKELEPREFPAVKDISCDARNCYLIFRDDNCKQAHLAGLC